MPSGYGRDAFGLVHGMPSFANHQNNEPCTGCGPCAYRVERQRRDGHYDKDNPDRGQSGTKRAGHRFYTIVYDHQWHQSARRWA